MGTHVGGAVTLNVPRVLFPAEVVWLSLSVRSKARDTLGNGDAKGGSLLMRLALLPPQHDRQEHRLGEELGRMWWALAGRFLECLQGKGKSERLRCCAAGVCILDLVVVTFYSKGRR